MERQHQREAYPSDLTDEQWSLIGPMIPPERPGGRHREVEMRDVLDGILYLVRSGCAWRAIPHDLPNCSTCRHYYDRFRADGTRARLHDALRDRVRADAGRARSPSAVIVDSQTVPTAGQKGGRGGTTRPRN